MHYIPVKIETEELITKVKCIDMEYNKEYNTLTLLGAIFNSSDYDSNLDVIIDGPNEITFRNVKKIIV